jgi:hypothetical protein
MFRYVSSRNTSVPQDTSCLHALLKVRELFASTVYWLKQNEPARVAGFAAGSPKTNPLIIILVILQ